MMIGFSWVRDVPFDTLFETNILKYLHDVTLPLSVINCILFLFFVFFGNTLGLIVLLYLILLLLLKLY